MKRRYSSPIAEQIFFHVVNKKHRWESLTAESRHFLDKHLKTDAPLQTTTVSVPANDKTAPWMPAESVSPLVLPSQDKPERITLDAADVGELSLSKLSSFLC
jgi:hypothetical protein